MEEREKKQGLSPLEPASDAGFEGPSDPMRCTHEIAVQVLHRPPACIQSGFPRFRPPRKHALSSKTQWRRFCCLGASRIGHATRLSSTRSPRQICEDHCHGTDGVHVARRAAVPQRAQPAVETHQRPSTLPHAEDIFTWCVDTGLLQAVTGPVTDSLLRTYPTSRGQSGYA